MKPKRLQVQVWEGLETVASILCAEAEQDPPSVDEIDTALALLAEVREAQVAVNAGLLDLRGELMPSFRDPVEDGMRA